MKRFSFWIAALFMLFAMGTSSANELLLGPGDELKITVYNSPDMAVQTRVSESGTIRFRCWARWPYLVSPWQLQNKKLPSC